METVKLFGEEYPILGTRDSDGTIHSDIFGSKIGTGHEKTVYNHAIKDDIVLKVWHWAGFVNDDLENPVPEEICIKNIEWSVAHKELQEYSVFEPYVVIGVLSSTRHPGWYYWVAEQKKCTPGNVHGAQECVSDTLRQLIDNGFSVVLKSAQLYVEKDGIQITDVTQSNLGILRDGSCRILDFDTVFGAESYRSPLIINMNVNNDNLNSVTEFLSNGESCQKDAEEERLQSSQTTKENKETQESVG